MNQEEPKKDNKKTLFNDGKLSKITLGNGAEVYHISTPELQPLLIAYVTLKARYKLVRGNKCDCKGCTSLLNGLTKNMESVKEKISEAVVNTGCKCKSCEQFIPSEVSKLIGESVENIYNEMIRRVMKH